MTQAPNDHRTGEVVRKVRLFVARLLVRYAYNVLYNATRIVPGDCRAQRTYMRGRIEQARERILPIIQD